METVTEPRLDDGPQPQEPEEAFGDGPQEDGYAGDLVIEGSDGQLGFDVGGKAPTSSSIRLQGGKIEIEGQFDKGQRLSLIVEVEVREVGFRDDVDGKTGQVVGCARNHRAHIIAVERANG